MVGCILANLFDFSNFFESFHTNMAQNHPQLQILPKKLLRLGQNGQIWLFCMIFLSFPPKWSWDWLGMINFTQFTTFPIFCHQSISFLEKSQKFSCSWQGGWQGTSANFLSFPTFSNHLTPMQLKMTHNCKFGQKSGLDWVKMAIFAYLSIFSPKMRPRLTRNGQFHLIHNFSHLLPLKHASFLEKSQNFLVGWLERGTSANVFAFSNFFKSFHTQCDWKWAHKWQIWPKKWLRLSQNGHFCIFFYLFPQNEAEIDSEWSTFTWFTTGFPSDWHLKHLIFGEISKIFVSGGGMGW